VNEEFQRIRAVRHRDPDYHSHSDDDMTQDIVLQLVDRTTGCSKIKLERRKRFFLLNRGKKTVSPRTLFINTQPQGG